MSSELFSGLVVEWEAERAAEDRAALRFFRGLSLALVLASLLWLAAALAVYELSGALFG